MMVSRSVVPELRRTGGRLHADAGVLSTSMFLVHPYLDPMNYHLAYSPIASATYVLDTPGSTPATVRGVRFRNLQRPWFPADPDIPNLRPTLLT